MAFEIDPRLLPIDMLRLLHPTELKAPYFTEFVSTISEPSAQFYNHTNPRARNTEIGQGLGYNTPDIHPATGYSIPMSSASIGFLFPGQGSQYRGIGQDLFNAHDIVKKTYQEASDVLGYDMAKLSFEDPADEIHLTRYTQPVLLTHSIACLRVFSALTDQRAQPAIVAGHSLGEYSALVCAKSLSFELALTLVKKRGELMGKLGEGEMEALMVDLDTAQMLAEQHYCSVAACNLPDQNVIGGRSEDLHQLTETMAENFPRKRSTRLKTEGAFHTFYMIDAARRFRVVLEQASFENPVIPVLSNYTGHCHNGDANAIKSQLFFQLFNPVLWHKNLLTAKEHGIHSFIEFGGGLGKGESPSEKRPNLESIVKKTFRDTGTPHYSSVINLCTLEETVGRFG